MLLGISNTIEKYSCTPGGDEIKILIVVFFISFFVLPANGASFSQHVVIGDWLGEIADTPAQAFVLGFASHVLLDSLPVQQSVINPWQPHPLILLELGLGGYTIHSARGDKNRMWGIFGAIFPDLIDGAFSILYPERWQRGEHFFWFHRQRGQKRLTHAESAFVSLALFSIRW